MSACPSRSALAGLLLLLPLAACSTSGVAPEIAAFATATGAAAEAGQAAGSGLSVSAEELAAARRRSLAVAGGYYARLPIGACSLASVSGDVQYRPLSETCPLRAVVPGPSGGEIAVATVFHTPAERLAAARVLGPAPGDEPRQRRYEASLLLREISAYAEALNTLAISEAPAEVAAQVSSSVGNLSRLHEGVAALKKAEGGRALNLPAYSELGALLQNLTAEALETKRYLLLRSLVTAYDPTIQLASAQLAVIAAQQERAAIAARQAAPGSTYVPADLAAVTASEDFDAATVGGMAAVEAAHARLLAADAGASYMAFSEIGSAHSAILAALQAPASAEQLLAANTRIQALVKTVEAYKAAR